MVRRPTEEERESIEVLLDAAFAPSKFESALVGWVRASGEAYHEWVYEQDKQVVGYVLYTLAYRGADSIGWHLAPVAVLPAFQNQGVGSALIRASLLKGPLSDDSVFVLGDPRYYERFGFSKQQSAQCPYDPGNEHFRALRWEDEKGVFEVGYSASFAKAEEAVGG